MKTKKVSVFARITALCMLFIFGIVSCSMPTLTVEPDAKRTTRESNTAERIAQFKADGIMNRLAELDMNDEALEGVDRGKLDFFLNRPEEALALIAKEPNGEAQLRLIDVMFNNGTVDDAIDALAALEPEMADEFLGAVEDIAEAMNLSVEELTLSRSVGSDGRPNIRTVPMRFYNDGPPNLSRGAFDADLEWSTVAWYAGLTVTTVLGAHASASWIPWVSIAGYVALIAGGISMGAQLIQWRDCDDLWNFAEALINLNASEMNAILQGDNGLQVMTIMAITLAGLAAVSFSPTGKLVINKCISLCESILSVIRKFLPAGVNWNISGVTINTTSVSNPSTPIPMPPPPPPAPKWWEVIIGKGWLW